MCEIERKKERKRKKEKKKEGEWGHLNELNFEKQNDSLVLEAVWCCMLVRHFSSKRWTGGRTKLVNEAVGTACGLCQ